MTKAIAALIWSGLKLAALFVPFGVMGLCVFLAERLGDASPHYGTLYLASGCYALGGILLVKS